MASFSLSYVNGMLTAKLENPPVQSPTSATISVMGVSTEVPITNNVASLPITLRKSVQNKKIFVTVRAVGVDTGQIIIGGTNDSTDIKAVLQADGSILVKNTSKAEIYDFYFNNGMDLREMLADIANMLDLYGDMLVKLMNWSQATSYAPLSLTSDERNAISAFANQYIPLLRLKLADAAPAAGSTIAQNLRWPNIINQKLKANAIADDALQELSDPDVK